MQVSVSMSPSLDTAAVVIRVHWLERLLGRRNREFVAKRVWAVGGYALGWVETEGTRTVTDRRVVAALNRAWWSADYEQRREAVARRVEAVRG